MKFTEKVEFMDLLFIDIFLSCKAARSFLADNPPIGITLSSRDYIETTQVKLDIEAFEFQKTCPIDIGRYKLIYIMIIFI